MSYKVLYRKYRPDSFKKIIGQDTIVYNLRRSVIESTFAHAYIFTGPRGTGKTSTAKVLAKAINCLNPVDGEACGKCDNCINFATSPDIIEIDAASNNGVDEIRELRANITLAPTSAKYKIYIIDEVHMLSAGAFNALLKTLEEPPEHAIFILATTEIYKVPITILSRCQRYDFKKMTKKDMVDHLKDVCKQESIKYDEEALDEIFELSEGCMRDALSVLDQTSKLQGNITLQELSENYSLVSLEKIDSLIQASYDRDINAVIEYITEFDNLGINVQTLLKKIINVLEKKAIKIKIGEEKNYNYQFISDLIKRLNDCYITARINENAYTMIKLAFIEAEGANSTIKKDTPKVSTFKKPEEKVTSESKPENLTVEKIRVNNCFVGAKKEELKAMLDIWQNIDSKKLKAVKAEDYTPVAASSDYVIFTAEESSLVNLFNIKHSDVEKSLKKSRGEVKVVALSKTEWTAAKQEYCKAIKEKKEYVIIQEPEIKKDDKKEIDNKLEDLFTDQLVEIS